ncbi:MAG: hypothetical protein RR951_07340 [Ruthenibacterium sp.]
MMWFFILLGIAIVVTFVVCGYRAAAKAANEPETSATVHTPHDTKKGPPRA